MQDRGYSGRPGHEERRGFQVGKWSYGRDFDLMNTLDKEVFEKLGDHVDTCPSIVGKAAAWATELVLEEISNRGMSLNDLPKTQKGSHR